MRKYFSDKSIILPKRRHVGCHIPPDHPLVTALTATSNYTATLSYNGYGKYNGNVGEDLLINNINYFNYVCNKLYFLLRTL